MLLHLGFEDDILAGDSKVDVSLADEGGNVGCGEEDTAQSTWLDSDIAACGMDRQCDVMVLHQTYVQSSVSPELDVGTCGTSPSRNWKTDGGTTYLPTAPSTSRATSLRIGKTVYLQRTISSQTFLRDCEQQTAVEGIRVYDDGGELHPCMLNANSPTHFITRSAVRTYANVLNKSWRRIRRTTQEFRVILAKVDCKDQVKAD